MISSSAMVSPVRRFHPSGAWRLGSVSAPSDHKTWLPIWRFVLPDTLARIEGFSLIKAPRFSVPFGK